MSFSKVSFKNEYYSHLKVKSNQIGLHISQFLAAARSLLQVILSNKLSPWSDESNDYCL